MLVDYRCCRIPPSLAVKTSSNRLLRCPMLSRRSPRRPSEACEEWARGYVPHSPGHGTPVLRTTTRSSGSVSARCSCEDGRTGAACDEHACEDPTCGGHGACVRGVCVCDSGFVGARCDVKACPGDPPCGGVGKCVAETALAAATPASTSGTRTLLRTLPAAAQLCRCSPPKRSTLFACVRRHTRSVQT